MPRGDRTGPWGLGPMTGRAAGYCAGYPVPGFMNPTQGYGRGFGFGRGGGRGFGRGRGRGFGMGFGRGWRGYPPQYQYAYPPPMQYAYPPSIYPPALKSQSQKQEVAALEYYKKELVAVNEDLKHEMTEIEARIKELRATLEKGKSQPSEP